MRRVDITRREVIDYTEFYWWKDELKTDAQFEAMNEKDKPSKEKKNAKDS